MNAIIIENRGHIVLASGMRTYKSARSLFVRVGKYGGTHIWNVNDTKIINWRTFTAKIYSKIYADKPLHRRTNRAPNRVCECAFNDWVLCIFGVDKVEGFTYFIFIHHLFFLFLLLCATALQKTTSHLHRFYIIFFKIYIQMILKFWANASFCVCS